VLVDVVVVMSDDVIDIGEVTAGDVVDISEVVVTRDDVVEVSEVEVTSEGDVVKAGVVDGPTQPDKIAKRHTNGRNNNLFIIFCYISPNQELLQNRTPTYTLVLK